MSAQLIALDQEPAPAAGTIYMDALLRPNRSLSQKGFVVMMVALAVTSFFAGLGFWAIGAWPVVGFFGLDVLLIFLAFKLNFKAGARESETVRVTAQAVAISRTTHRGETGWWQVSPAFARVQIDQPNDFDADIRLAAGGQAIPLATCLSVPERLAFAKALEAALHNARQERFPDAWRT
jgi:uncharacterized membrane protein